MRRVPTPRSPGAALPGDHRPSVAVFAAITGNALTQLGVPWFVLPSTGSAAKAGIVACCTLLPLVLPAIAGGPVIDRNGRPRTGIASDLVCGAAVAAVPLLQFGRVLQFWMLGALMAVTGLFRAPGETARGVLLPALAGRTAMPHLSVTTASALTVGPLGDLAAGFLVDSAGLFTTMLAVGGGYLLATLCPVIFPARRQMDAPGASSRLRVGVRPRPTSGDPPRPGHPRRQREVHLPAGASLSIVRPPCRSLGDPRTGRGDDDDQTG